MENLVTTQDTTSEKKRDYLDLVDIVTEEDVEFVAIAPRGSRINANDVVEINGMKAKVIQTLDWCSTDSEAFQFISKMYPNMPKIDSVWVKKELRWDS